MDLRSISVFRRMIDTRWRMWKRRSRNGGNILSFFVPRTPTSLFWSGKDGWRRPAQVFMLAVGDQERIKAVLLSEQCLKSACRTTVLRSITHERAPIPHRFG